MRNAADEYGEGVRFNAIRPGFIATEIMEGVPRDQPPTAATSRTRRWAASASPTTSRTSRAS